MAEKTKKKSGLTERLLAWYEKNKRDLPWRRTTDPYAIWVSEIMLQQTQVDTVIPYYLRFLASFPTVEALADAPLEGVLKAWENLGYYTRARQLHKAARIIAKELKGRLPHDPEDLVKLPGIGAYTAGAVASIAFNRRVPAVDGNVKRVLCRVFAVDKSPKEPKVARHLETLAWDLVPEQNPGEYNAAVMDLGAVICRPKSPRCPECPLVDLCQARAQGLENELPVKDRKPKIPHRLAACAVIVDDQGRLLVVQRPATGLLASLWKLPGGFCEEISRMQEELIREVKNELGINIRVGEKLAQADHVYTHFRLTLYAFQARMIAGEPRPAGCQAFLWAGKDDLDRLAWSKVDRSVLSQLDTTRRMK